MNEPALGTLRYMGLISPISNISTYTAQERRQFLNYLAMEAHIPRVFRIPTDSYRVVEFRSVYREQWSRYRAEWNRGSETRERGSYASRGDHFSGSSGGHRGTEKMRIRGLRSGASTRSARSRFRISASHLSRSRSKIYRTCSVAWFCRNVFTR